jgi:alpha-glucosidase
MQWDATARAGFTTGRPWLPIAADAELVNVAAQRDDPASLFSFYRRVIWLRHGSPALRAGSYRSLRAPRGVFAYVREADGERLMVTLNFLDRSSRVSIAENADVVLSTSDGRTGDRLQPAVELGPNEGIVAKLS